jgi:hypothetical protein
MKSAKETFYANRGVERNKKPLKNIVYKFEVKHLKPDVPADLLERMEPCKFKEEGYIFMLSGYQGLGEMMGWNGSVTPEQVKELIGEKQWGKFCQGKREFIIQRRINKHNIPKNKVS